MKNGLDVNGAGLHDYEDVPPVGINILDDSEIEDEVEVEDFEEADFTGASDELGYTNDR